MLVVSEARIAANRKNAAKSTGPKTPEGKERSRANALKHGLCASVCVPEDLEAVQRRTADWFHSLKPQNEFHCWLVNEVAITSLRIDRSERMERRVRDKVALYAELTWDDDRRLEARILGGMLAGRPAETVEALRRTPHGCDWMIDQWAMLAGAARADNTWTAEQTRLAFDLLATPEAFRVGKPGATIDVLGNAIDPADDLVAVANRQVEELLERREVVAGLDEVERALTEADLTNDADPELRRLRRYESALHRRMQWCLGQLNHQSPHKATSPGLFPRWTIQPEPAPKPEPPTAEEKAAEAHPKSSPHPPFDLRPEEVPPLDQPVDIPAILKSRKRKRLERAESRREAKRRKLERLRA